MNNNEEHFLNEIKENYEAMNDQWHLATIMFEDLPDACKTIVMTALNAYAEENNDCSHWDDLDNEAGVHLYWDKSDNDIVFNMGVFAYGSGDGEIDVNAFLACLSDEVTAALKGYRANHEEVQSFFNFRGNCTFPLCRYLCRYLWRYL